MAGNAFRIATIYGKAYATKQYGPNVFLRWFSKRPGHTDVRWDRLDLALRGLDALSERPKREDK